MSDPMTNIGADDVLASIRRLVSGTQESQVHKAPSSDAPERFVLSPDLRVVDGNAELSLSSAQDHDTDKDPEQSSSQDDTSSATDPQADLPPLILEQTSATHFPREVETTPLVETIDETTAAQPSGLSDHDHTDVVPSEDAAETEPTATSAVDAAVHAAQAVSQDIEWTPTFDDTPDANAANHAAGLSLEERIAELESAVDSQSDNWDADGSDDFDDEPPKVFPRAFAEPTARVLSFRSAYVGPFAGAEFDTDSVDFSEDTAFVGEPDADESVVDDALANDALTDGALATGSVDITLDATATATDTDSGTAEVTGAAQEPVETPLSKPADVFQASQPTDQAAAQTDAAIAEAAAEGDDDFALAGYSADELFDEGALRDMIAEVIREELQGDLGERITRNVRRLVRREVQRALTLREFE